MLDLMGGGGERLGIDRRWLPVGIAYFLGLPHRVLGIVYRCIVTHLMQQAGFPPQDGPGRRGRVDPVVR
jgi:hypothetical protein